MMLVSWGEQLIAYLRYIDTARCPAFAEVIHEAEFLNLILLIRIVNASYTGTVCLVSINLSIAQIDWSRVGFVKVGSIRVGDARADRDAHCGNFSGLIVDSWKLQGK